MSQTVSHQDGVLVMPRGEIMQRGPVVAARLIPVCRSPKCADVDLVESNPTLTIYAVLRAEAGMIPSFAERYRDYMDEGHRRAVVRAVPQREEVKHG